MENGIRLTSLTPSLQPQWLNNNNGVSLIRSIFLTTKHETKQRIRYRPIKSKLTFLSSLLSQSNFFFFKCHHEKTAVAKVPVLRTGGKAHLIHSGDNMEATTGPREEKGKRKRRKKNQCTNKPFSRNRKRKK